MPVLEFMTFPHDLILFGSFPNVFDGELRYEVLLMAEEISVHRMEIFNRNQARRKLLSKAVEIEMVMPISLTDVFSVLESRKFPLHWKEYLKTNVIMPTTVCCEQSFSVIKQSTHINMKPETFIANATNKLYERSILKLY